MALLNMWFHSVLITSPVTVDHASTLDVGDFICTLPPMPSPVQCAHRQPGLRSKFRVLHRGPRSISPFRQESEKIHSCGPTEISVRCAGRHAQGAVTALGGLIHSPAFLDLRQTAGPFHYGDEFSWSPFGALSGLLHVPAGCGRRPGLTWRFTVLVPWSRCRRWVLHRRRVYGQGQSSWPGRPASSRRLLLRPVHSNLTPIFLAFNIYCCATGAFGLDNAAIQWAISNREGDS